MVVLEDYCKWYVAAGTMMPKVCNTDLYGCHQTLPGVSHIVMANLFSPESVILSSEEDYGKLSLAKVCEWADVAGGGVTTM